ncbi:MAG: DUF4153 domain-containing protein [Porphyromonadaceae bacterium]|nr:DUF4153 domain-containing protein [Porphyromonadaceae bacterium]
MTNHTQKNTSKGFWGRFSNFGEKLLTALTRFPLTFACVVAVAVLFISMIHSDKDDNYVKWMMAGVVSAFATLSVYLFAENRINKLITNGINVILIALSVWLFSTFPNSIRDAHGTQFVMLMVSFLLAVFFAGYISEKNSLKWWNFLQNTLFQLVISAFFAGVLMAGLSLAIVSLDKLFGLKINDDVYGYLAVFCFVLFAPSYFMSQLAEKPTPDTKFSITYPAIFKILGLYILLPILSIYTVILYGYLFKIIATWELPNGWVSWLVSILGFVGFIVIIVLHPISNLPPNPLKNAPQPPEGGVLGALSNFTEFERRAFSPFRGLGGRALFARFFPLILIPLLILMFVGIVRRFSDYGITINRLLVLILNLWFFGTSIYVFISCSRQPKWILTSFATVAFLSAVGPWNVMRITEKSLKKEFSELLAEAGWTNTPDADIRTLSKQKQSRLSDVAYYLQSTYGLESIRPMFSVLENNANVYQLLTALNISERLTNSNRFYINGQEKSDVFDITGYKKMIRLKSYDMNKIYNENGLKIRTENEQLIVNQNGKTIILSLREMIENSISELEEAYMKTKDLTIENDDCKLIIYNLYGNIEEQNKLKIDYMDGLLFLK